MNVLTLEELQRLTTPKEGWCVSIYMPTVKKGDQVRQNPIRYKNLLDEAEAKLEQFGMKPNDITRFMSTAEELQRDDVFWQTQENGLAVFIAEGEFYTYHLPMEVEEQVLIKDRFYLKPLLSLLYQGGEYFILALSQDEVRLFRATEHEIDEVYPKDLPENMDEALGYDNLEDQQQWHTGTAPAPGGGRRQAMFHGQGQGEDKSDAYFLRYLRIVNDSVIGYLGDRRSPLILAGVEELLPEYKKSNTYLHLVDDIITMKPAIAETRELRERAWEKVKSVFDVTREEILGRYKQLAGRNDDRATKDVKEVLKAAPYGRVEVLFVDKTAKQWGKFDEQNVEVKLEDQPNKDNYDLLDYAAVQTLLNGGIVYAVEPQDIPDAASPVAAILRF
jgi:peptide subunit release factor 1 (eRF1)